MHAIYMYECMYYNTHYTPVWFVVGVGVGVGVGVVICIYMYVINNTDLVVDITIVNAYIHNAQHTEHYALSLLEKYKNRKYKEAYRNVGIDFKPLAMEMHGATSDIFTKFFKKLAHAAALKNEIHYCIMYSYSQKRVYTGIYLLLSKRTTQRSYFSTYIMRILKLLVSLV
jgi:hypothetical protein